MPNREKLGVDDRALEFVCEVIRFIRTIPADPGIAELSAQLVGAAGSIGANRAEGSGGSSRAEFRRFNEIALRSAKETVFWLRVCQRSRLGDLQGNEALLDEAQQITRILAAVVLTAKRNSRRTPAA